MKIPGILELSSRTKYGMTSRNVPIYLFRPLDSKQYSLCIVGCSHKDISSNVLAIVDVGTWETNKLTRGNLHRIIGKCGDFKAEDEALTFQYQKEGWSPGITVCIPGAQLERHKITGISFNIDPEGCRDIDDVFTIGDDGYFYITIADVSEWMKENPESLRKAQTIGQTQYSIDGRILQSMIPFEQDCSLIPGVERMGVSLRFKITDCKIVDVEFVKTRITNTISYTYDSVYRSEYADTLKHVVHTLGCTSPDSHDWVAQLMIFYNIEAAKVLKQKGQGILRVHSVPDIEKLESYKSLGVDAQFLAFKSAKYVPTTTDEKHWGLNADVYCHATSPIRRFADVVNQYVLKNEQPPVVDIDMLNERSKQLKIFARDSFFLRQLLQTDARSVEGTVLNDHRIWVPAWKRIVTCKNDYPIGTTGTLNYSLDMNQSTWKRRVVFKFVSTANQE
jgi:exoribonuclease R